MTEPKEATDPPNTLLGLGPPEPPEPSIVVNLAKTDTKDASVVTVRAWSTSQSDFDALTSASNDDEMGVLPFAAPPARRGMVLAALGAVAFAGAFALTSTFRHPTAPRAAGRASSPRVTSRPPTTTVLVGGPWVLRAGEAAEAVPGEVPEVRGASELPEYLVRSTAASGESVPRAVTGSHEAGVALRSETRGARVITDPAERGSASDPDRIRSVADAVELEDDDSVQGSPSD